MQIIAQKSYTNRFFYEIGDQIFMFRLAELIEIFFQVPEEEVKVTKEIILKG